MWPKSQKPYWQSSAAHLPYLFDKVEPIIYSKLLKEIENGNVQSLDLIPARREVVVTFQDGSVVKAPILPNDQNILRVAQASNTPLTVKDLKQEQFLAGLLGNVGLIVLVVIGLSFLFKRSAQAANKAMGFGKSQARIKPNDDIQVRFEDVAGINEAKEELNEVVSFLIKPDTYTKLGATIPRGVLLVGPPGTGKTLLAKAIAGEAGVPFFSIAASEFVELFVGVGASRVRDLFAKAKEKSPSIVFIDEIDSVGRQRGAGIGGGNDEREQTLNQLLTEMDGFTDNTGVIVIAATNRADVLDTALMRPGRFDRCIQIGLPDRIGRKGILAVHARSRPIDVDVSLSDWAARTPGFSGADLENLINESAILTARHEKKSIGNKEIERALERITLGLTSSPLQDITKKRLIAYHEAGHALVATYTPNADKVDKLTILPRSGGIGGFTRFSPNEEDLDSGLLTKAALFARMVVSLGGRAAELVVFGSNEVTQGSSNDLLTVTTLAREMVTRFGFSSLGPISLDTKENEIFLGRDLLNSTNRYSDSTGKAIDHQIRDMANKAMQLAMQILIKRRNELDKLVDVLVEEETIHSEEFLKIINHE